MVPVTMGTLGESLAEFRVKVIGSLGSVNETYKGADYGGCVAALHVRPCFPISPGFFLRQIS